MKCPNCNKDLLLVWVCEETGELVPYNGSVSPISTFTYRLELMEK